MRPHSSLTDPANMNPTAPFELRAGMQLMQRLILCDADTDRFRDALAQTVTRAPAMFRGAPLVLDLTPLRESDSLPDFAALQAALREVGIVPAGLCNAGPDQVQAARAAGWVILERLRTDDVASRGRAARPPVRIVTQPVRSGQQIYAPGDLMLLAPVSAGAEVLAGGSIHVHAPLRGRALAGVEGDGSAVISCAALDAELVAIAGHYRTFEEAGRAAHGGPVLVRLEDEHLRIVTV